MAWRRLFHKQKFAFLTGDLGFMALEPLRDEMREFFINAGIAEQNMVSVAAGVVKSGLPCWIYSIAPFAYARPFEQIRNDVCLNHLPVFVVGNGGGYGYGAMGPSHHAIEDYGVLLALQNMRVFVPAFAEDVECAIGLIAESKKPAYLRLGRCEKPLGFEVPQFQSWRRLAEGHGPVLVVIGPIVGQILARVLKINELSPDLWVVGIMPCALETIPEEILEAVRCGRTIAVVEEHVAQGSFGQALARELALRELMPRRFVHFCAKGYPSGSYGSQSFHRRESGIDVETVMARLREKDI